MSGSAPTLGATVLAHTKNIKIIVALWPNTVYPTVAAKSLATLDQLSGGRVVVHFIAGGNDDEQAREGESGIKPGQPSTWQSFTRGTSSEVDYLNGEITLQHKGACNQRYRQSAAGVVTRRAD